MKTDTKVRVKEALAYYTLKTGNRMTKTELASRLWPNSSIKSGQTVLSNYEAGRIKRIDITALRKICEICGVDANFLLNVQSMEVKK